MLQGKHKGGQKIKLILPAQHAVVSLQTDTQKAFIEDEENRAKLDGALQFYWYDLKKTRDDATIPLPVTFQWEAEETDTFPEEAYYYLLVSEKEDMGDPWVYITKESRYDVYNLKVGTVYFWCVQRNGKRSEVSSFETQLTLPRCIKLDTVSNVRDMGGYPVEEGRIRQGLVYRGGEFELHMQLYPSGIAELQRLGIRTELDMRGEAKGKVDFTTAELAGVQRAYIPSVPYETVLKTEYRADVKKFFKVFANPKNYPIYYHCWGGADRTGTFAFILGAFLGMRYEDLIYEYEYTSLSIWGTRSRNYDKFQLLVQGFMELEGDTLREKATTFLKKKAGLTDKQLTVIYDTLVEKDT